jgi:hypothetical protein
MSSSLYYTYVYVHPLICRHASQVAVDVSANQLDELCTVAFQEEVDRLLGRNSLFKRSVLLVKAWWLYESRAYTGSNMLACISERALTAMVLAVVNQHHKRLFTPLQVLAMFFHTYASFEWSRQCVSIDGHKNIDELQKSSSSSSSSSGIKRTSSGAVHDTTATTTSTAQLPTDLTDPLLSDELLSKYRDRCVCTICICIYTHT